MSGRPGLGALSFASDAGGVGYVARLLRRALLDADTDPWLVELGMRRRDPPTIAARLRFLGQLAVGAVTRRADWMLFNHVDAARALWAIPSIVRQPYGVFVHDLDVWSPDLSASRLATLTDARVLISNSAFTASRARAAHEGRLRPVPCPLGLMDPEPIAGDPDATLVSLCGPATALIVGRVTSDERYKGHDQLIEAWPMVRAAVKDARLLVAGWGDDVDRLRRKATALGVAEAICFAGYVSEATLDALFARAGAYAMPSGREGFGLVYLEAMRRGVPCIGSTLDAAGEVIAHGETGFLVDRDDARELAGALVTLLGNPLRRQAMGAAARRRFQQHFTYEHFRGRLYPILAQAFPGFERCAALGAGGLPRGPG